MRERIVKYSLFTAFVLGTLTGRRMSYGHEGETPPLAAASKRGDGA